MFQAQRPNCKLLAVLCGEFSDDNSQKRSLKEGNAFPLPELTSTGRLEVNVLVNPTLDKFREAQKMISPSLLYFRGQQSEVEEEIGPLIWSSVDLSEPEILSSLIGPSLPTIVYLEVPNGDRIAQALRTKGVPYVIYWKNPFSFYSASQFRQALFSVVQSSISHTWDAFQLAHASFRLFCVRNNYVMPCNAQQKASSKLGPRLSGDAPKINIPKEVGGDEKEEIETTDAFPAIKVYNDAVDVRFLVCGLPCTLDACLLGSLEDGLNALLNIEIRGSKLQNRVSSAPPPLEEGALSRGVVTMRCDLTTSSSAHISILVSGSPQTCFDDQLLESHIKDELIEKSQLVHAMTDHDDAKLSLSEPARSTSVACGASTFQVWMKVPSWAVQILCHLAQEPTHRTLVALGIASIQGISVAAFEKRDSDRLLFFCSQNKTKGKDDTTFLSAPPDWSAPLVRKRAQPGLDLEANPSNKRMKLSSLRPIPHARKQRMVPFVGVRETEVLNDLASTQTEVANPVPVNHEAVHVKPVRPRKPASTSLHAREIITLNSMPVKKHQCERNAIRACSEEEFLKDVMDFLIQRGHSRLVPQGGVSEFPDVILNAKRLDLFNLYKEVVSRGGFYVGNGINWKGQVFSKMRNHTASNKMTGVGNTLKRHYQTYLLEYELAHDDVDGECCLLCHSSAPGDWVNCGLCGEWAHFGCDRRQGLGAFKDYAKTDGLEYICPQCSLTNSKRKAQRVANGFSNSVFLPQHV
ncbi:AT-rich interactive domain-containing protein 4 [Rhynchospora pubera]|uniref:AT-rich interactive domain-containing protein 4 n=1 Tax=Rhynchospora pubera TaxID=906938 RepID=A0AAV8H9S0_9POAL|nr:AT-rich interactive domain-containing protein 4 [Rhynchospora pubera]